MTTKNDKRNMNHIFIGFPQKDDGVSRRLRNLQSQLMTGQLEEFGYCFSFYEAQSFSAPQARNIIVAEARKTNAGRLLMIDADMTPTPAHVQRILSHEHRVIGGLYPKKIMSEKGASWVANFGAGDKKDENGVSDCIEVGTGFMKIDMDVFDTLIAAGVVNEYFSDVEGLHGQIQHDFFEEAVVVAKWGPGSAPWARRIGEDFHFCFLCKLAGIPVKVDCNCQVGHVGPVDFLELYALIERNVKDAQEDGAK